MRGEKRLATEDDTTVTIPLIILSVKDKDLVLACLQVGVTMRERSTRKGPKREFEDARIHGISLASSAAARVIMHTSLASSLS